MVPSWTFVSFVVSTLNSITTKDTKVHQGKPGDGGSAGVLQFWSSWRRVLRIRTRNPNPERSIVRIVRKKLRTR
jgi:hypothetical protein